MAEESLSNMTNNELKKSANARAVFYKKPVKRHNYKLDVSVEDTPQEIRRQRLLQFQKNSRDNAFNNVRGILESTLNSEDEDEEDMEVSQNEKPYFYSRQNKHYANQLMMSEWMLEVPYDFVDKWILVPCPYGRRTLVIAAKGETKAYNRRGYRLGKFNSALPGGNPEEHRSSCTILDCIWITEQKTYYVLDVLAWSNQPLLNCDAEFRLFWLKSQLLDKPELQERGTYRNTFPILPLPNINCNENICSFLANLSLLPPLDGILFYHRDGQYTKGHTPLVTWLKPFMLPEVLSIAVPPILDEKPNGYIDFQHYITDCTRKGKSKRAVEHTMEVTEDDS